MRRTLFRCFPDVVRRVLLWQLAFLLPASLAVGAPVQFSAVVRDGKTLIKKDVALEDLVSDHAFEGRYFKVVLGQTDEPVAFDAPADLKLKAATVYHTMTESRKVMKNLLAQLLPHLPADQQNYLDGQLVLRLEMTHPYSSAIHFDLRDPVYNGAVTIPPSDIFRDDQVPPCQTEIWFFSGKRQKVDNPAEGIAEALGSSAYKWSIFEGLAQQDAVDLAQNAARGTFSGTVLAENLAVTLGLSFVVAPTIARIIRSIPAHIYLDAAMIPEIAANEYAHYALSPWLGLKRRFHVGEGYAHYFAYKITGLEKLQAKAGRYSKGFSPIRGDSKEMYDSMKEVGAYAAMSSFTFSVLCDLEKALGEEGVPVIIGTLPYLGSDSSLNGDFARAVFSSAQQRSELLGRAPSVTNFWVHSVLTKRGF